MFAREGATVVLTDVLEEQGEETAAEIREEGGDAVFYSLGVSDEDDREALLGTVADEYGQLGVLVNNAGVLRGGSCTSWRVTSRRR